MNNDPKSVQAAREAAEEATGKKRFTSLGNWIYNRNILIAVSIIFSVTLWAILTLNVNQKTEKIIRDVPIDIYDSGLYEQYGMKAIEIVGPDVMLDRKVDITVTGGLYALSKVSADNISVKAVQNGTISEPASYRLALYVTCSIDDVEVNFADGTNYVLIRYDRYTEKSSPIDVLVTTNGASAAEGLVVGEAFSTVKTISLKGPETEVNRIAGIVLSANVNKTLTATESFSGELLFYDENGQQLTEEERSKITIVAYSDGKQEFEGAPTESELTVQVPIDKVVTLPLEATFKNLPKGFDTSTLSYTLDPAEIKLEGKADAIDALAAGGKYTLDSQIDLSALTPNNPTQKLKLSVNSGITIEDGITDVTASFDIQKYGVRSLNLTKETTTFALLNADGLNASIVSEKLENVIVVGPTKTLLKLDPSDCVVCVDLASFDNTTGRKIVKANIYFKNIDNCWTTGTYSLTVRFS